MQEKLPRRQAQILGFIRSQLVPGRVPPTLREIGTRFGIRAPTVLAHLRALERKGVLLRQKRRSRSIALTDSDSDDLQRARTVPVLGRIPAGVPVLADENIERRLVVDAGSLPRGQLFALSVTGDSMSGAGILSGDTVIVLSQQTAHDGDIVVALVDGEATVKRFRKDHEGLRLVPENPAYRPVSITLDRVQIQGKVLAVQRVFRT